MGKGSGQVRLFLTSPEEAMAAGLAQRAVVGAAEALRAGGYPRPSELEFKAIAAAATRGALALPYLVADMAAATEQQLEEAAEALGAAVVAEILGPPRMLQ